MDKYRFVREEWLINFWTSIRPVSSAFGDKHEKPVREGFCVGQGVAICAQRSDAGLVDQFLDK